MSSDLHLPSFIEGLTALNPVPLKAIAAEMGYSETHFSRIREQATNDFRFALRFAAAVATLVERQRNASNRTR